MAGKTVELTEDNFETTIVKEKMPSLVDFWAPWCGPCKMIAPLIEELADEYEGRVNFGKLNVDEQSNIAMQYGIRSIPTILFFKDGIIANQIVGVRSKRDLTESIDSLL